MKPDTTNPDPYARTFRVAKWNRFVRVTDVPRLFKRLPEFRDWTRAQHTDTAVDYLAQSYADERVYQDIITRALRTYGDHGPLISGIVRDHFPDRIKTDLRQLAQRISTFRDRSVAHWQAAGKRIDTWRRLNEEYRSQV